MVMLLSFFGFFNVSIRGLAILFVAAVAIDFFANYYFVRHYLYRKIKLIYKVIHKHKMSREFSAEKVNMDNRILSDVEKEVDEWAERNAQEYEEMEKMAAYRRRFVGDVSHELKTPIFNIQGFIYTLLDGAMDDPEVRIQYLNRAAKNVDRLQAIVEDLETINKLEAGQMLMEMTEFDVHELAIEVFSDLEMRAKERNIRLVFKEGADHHFMVRADRDSIHQVFVNLVVNSIKYSQEGGTSKISFYDMESFVLVEVSDSGFGIPTEHLPHVFDRFYRVDKSRSRDAGGTGLGLSIVKHIIEAHKQTINVRSTPGQGSTFGFTLEKV
jgi:two-component system, OmpR family, phosphate regulon sensor histidine kinase PhoR